VVGAFFGYLSGCVMAGIFFVQERFRRRSAQPVKIELLPFSAADFETLTSWVRHAQLFELWSRGRFQYPLNHDQLAARSSLPAGEPPNRLCLKAVCGEMWQMVAYVELTDIDREKLHASIELAIVDPSRNDRDQLSAALVGETLQQAFNQQGLQSLSVVLHRSEAESLDCFRKRGFSDVKRETPSDETREFRELEYRRVIPNDQV
jgi:hypothetical protein